MVMPNQEFNKRGYRALCVEERVAKIASLLTTILGQSFGFGGQQYFVSTPTALSYYQNGNCYTQSVYELVDEWMAFNDNLSQTEFFEAIYEAQRTAKRQGGVGLKDFIETLDLDKISPFLKDTLLGWLKRREERLVKVRRLKAVEENRRRLLRQGTSGMKEEGSGSSMESPPSKDGTLKSTDLPRPQFTSSVSIVNPSPGPRKWPILSTIPPEPDSLSGDSKQTESPH